MGEGLHKAINYEHSMIQKAHESDAVIADAEKAAETAKHEHGTKEADAKSAALDTKKADTDADARCHEQDGQHHPTLLRGSLQGDQGGGHQLLEEDWLRPRQDPIHPYLRLPRRQHDRGLHQHGLVQGPMSARLPRHRQASKEASG